MALTKTLSRNISKVSKGLLLLHPSLPRRDLEIDLLIKQLQQIGFLGNPVKNLPYNWLTGDKFLNLVTFMGCSPHVRLEPESDNDTEYSYVSISQTQIPDIRYSDTARPPRCIECGKPVTPKWENLSAGEADIGCAFCNHRHPDLYSLRWKNDSGISDTFIEIKNIYPGEAQPVPSLMNSLEKLTECSWRYFYLYSR